MIDARELRIGNFLNFHGKVRRVTAQEIYRLSDGACLDENPIHITDETLVIFKITKCFAGAEYWYDISGNNWFKLKFEDSGIYPVWGHEYLNEIQYIHQLQNLYFALTANELEIKP